MYYRRGEWVEIGGSTKNWWGPREGLWKLFDSNRGLYEKKVTTSKVVDHFYVKMSIIWGVYQKISEFIVISTHPPPANIKWTFPKAPVIKRVGFRTLLLPSIWCWQWPGIVYKGTTGGPPVLPLYYSGRPSIIWGQRKFWQNGVTSITL